MLSLLYTITSAGVDNVPVHVRLGMRTLAAVLVAGYAMACPTALCTRGNARMLSLLSMMTSADVDDVLCACATHLNHLPILPQPSLL